MDGIDLKRRFGRAAEPSDEHNGAVRWASRMLDQPAKALPVGSVGQSHSPCPVDGRPFWTPTEWHPHDVHSGVTR